MTQGGTLTLRSAPETLDKGQPAVQIEFVDTGMGIPAEHVKRVFEPFFTTKEEGKGTGLGLAICRRAVEDHHGTIQILSEVGKGTTVRIKLPVKNRLQRGSTPWHGFGGVNWNVKPPRLRCNKSKITKSMLRSCWGSAVAPCTGSIRNMDLRRCRNKALRQTGEKQRRCTADVADNLPAGLRSGPPCQTTRPIAIARASKVRLAGRLGQGRRRASEALPSVSALVIELLYKFHYLDRDCQEHGI